MAARLTWCVVRSRVQWERVAAGWWCRQGRVSVRTAGVESDVLASGGSEKRCNLVPLLEELSLALRVCCSETGCFVSPSGDRLWLCSMRSIWYLLILLVVESCRPSVRVGIL